MTTQVNVRLDDGRKRCDSCGHDIKYGHHGRYSRSLDECDGCTTCHDLAAREGALADARDARSLDLYR